ATIATPVSRACRDYAMEDGRSAFASALCHEYGDLPANVIAMHHVTESDPFQFRSRRRVPHRYTPYERVRFAEHGDLRFDKLAPAVSLCPQRLGHRSQEVRERATACGSKHTLSANGHARLAKVRDDRAHIQSTEGCVVFVKGVKSGLHRRILNQLAIRRRFLRAGSL